jgi:hypothetical protein
MGLQEPHSSREVAEATDRVLDNEESDEQASIGQEAVGEETESGGFGARFPKLKAVGRVILAWITGSILVALVVYLAGLSLAAFTPPAQITMVIISTVIMYYVFRNRTRF